MTVFHVDDVHTPEMIDHELMLCISDMKPMVTLANFLDLCQARSPFVFGGEITDEDRQFAFCVVNNPFNLKGGKFDAALRMELAAISRAFEIIVPEKQAGPASQIPPYGPEWMTNLMAAAADAIPSLTVPVMLRKMSMVMLVHLVAASHRKNGGRTKRPTNAEAAFKLLQSLDQADGAGHGEQPVDDVGQVHGHEIIDLEKDDGGH